jgi:hypothetical protein
MWWWTSRSNEDNRIGGTTSYDENSVSAVKNLRVYVSEYLVPNLGGAIEIERGRHLVWCLRSFKLGPPMQSYSFFFSDLHDSSEIELRI